MTKHALFSASSAYIWTWCPWSALLGRFAEDKPAGTAAKKGTKLHALAAEWYTEYEKGNFDYQPPICEGLSGVRTYVEYLIKEEQAGQRPVVEEYIGDPMYLYGGTPDARMLKEIVDLKTGQNLVKADGNLQLEFLAWVADMHNATLTIIQNGDIRSAPQKESGQIFIDAIQRATTEEPKLVKGERCKMCKAKSVCPAWGNAAQKKEDSNGF